MPTKTDGMYLLTQIRIPDGHGPPSKPMVDHQLGLRSTMAGLCWWMPGSVTNGFLWSRWCEKRSRHSRFMRKPQFCLSGKRPMAGLCWIRSGYVWSTIVFDSCLQNTSVNHHTSQVTLVSTLGRPWSGCICQGQQCSPVAYHGHSPLLRALYSQSAVMHFAVYVITHLTLVPHICVCESGQPRFR